MKKSKADGNPCSSGAASLGRHRGQPLCYRAHSTVSDGAVCWRERGLGEASRASRRGGGDLIRPAGEGVRIGNVSWAPHEWRNFIFSFYLSPRCDLLTVTVCYFYNRNVKRSRKAKMRSGRWEVGEEGVFALLPKLIQLHCYYFTGGGGGAGGLWWSPCRTGSLGDHSWEAPPGAASGTSSLWASGQADDAVVAVVQWRSRVRLCDPMDCSTLLFPVLHYLL